MKGLKAGLIVLGLFVVAGIAAIYSGAFSMAADEPHWGITERLVTTMRDRSIAVRARSVGAPPALDDPDLLAMGAEHYAEMCTGCHLAPGMKETELRAGLYPKPPNLAERAGHRSAEETFWIIEHGVKLSGMPAWGVTHDDRSVWAMTALVRKLNELSPGEYEELVARGRAAGHEHGGDEASEQEEGHAHDTEHQHVH